MRGAPFLVLALLLAAGCVAPDPVEDDVASQSPADASGTYWFVHVQGTQGRFEGYMCDRSHTHVVREDAREVVVDASIYPFDPALVRSLVSLQVDDGAGCPLADSLHANGEVASGSRVRDLRASIDEETGVASVEVGGSSWTVEPGRSLQFHDDGQTLDIVVVNHGAWPQAGLNVTDDGPYW